MFRRVVVSSGLVSNGCRAATALVSSSCINTATQRTTTTTYTTTSQVRLASSSGGGIEVRSATEGTQEDAVGDHFEGEEDEGEVLDLVEASLQECHDLSIALHENLQRLGAVRARRTGPDTSRNHYSNHGDAMKGMELYHVHIEKLLFHISQPQVVPRMLRSAGQIKHDKREKHNKVGMSGPYRTDQPHKGLPSLRMEASSYPQMLRHAPYEAANVRSDMPAHIGDNARSLRDNDTILILAKLIKMKHPRGMELVSTWLELMEKAPAATFEASSIMSDE